MNLYSPREAAGWWALYRARGRADRFTIIATALPGDLVDVACDDREGAEWLRGQMVERGIPKPALTVIRD
ncbi:hypothetical protein ACWCRC_37530 [Streptomyces sp. NPDC001940]